MTAWYETYIVKDAINILTKVAKGKQEYVNSFQPGLLDRLVNVMLDCVECPKDFKFQVQSPVREYPNLCLTSGGADSTIAWYYAFKPQGIYIDIGQPYAHKERRALHLIDIPYYYVDMRGTRIADCHWGHIIPGRNFLFLCVAAEMVKDNGSIWFAMLDGEGAASGKGDKSLLFVELFEDWYTACTGRRVHIQTMVDRTKPGWLKWFAESHDVNIIRKTVTCFSAEDGQCGACQACLRKFLSFVSIGKDISADFMVPPMVGAKQYVEKYETLLPRVLEKRDFTHYSRNRCLEDLQAISDAKLL